MQVRSHIIYRTACHQYVVACHRLPILYRTICHSIPMEQGAFTCNSAYRTSVPIQTRAIAVYIKSLCNGKEYLPVCTDTITKSGLYCQQLFLSFTYLFIGLVGGMLTLSRGPVPLDSYRASQTTGFVKYFFRLFYLFLTFSRGGAA